MQYYDKSGVLIKSGMKIRIADGEAELVYDTSDSFGNPDLGISASNENYLKRHPDECRVYYSLKNFNMLDVEVVL